MTTTAKAAPTLCPSSRCEDGNLLIGIVTGTGLISLLPDALEVDAEFNRIAREGRAPEQRFRFASPCLGNGCQQWNGSRCGVIDEAIALAPIQEAAVSMPTCAIRAQCRWFKQQGVQACGVCPLVITDSSGTALQAVGL
ncbi:hypothetical protein [Deinococcus marmoris]|uniref:hypothetical protein n=1 Tax=Deinococcus marmoris TaxID=249408 RepID=UPI00096A9493|nr:hypothetical protein [Deinococcus marmoris]